MARRRNSKGQFVKGGGGSRRRRPRRRGMGSIITVRRGMGALDMQGALPVLIGGGLAALTSLGLRWFVNPAAGQTQNMLVKWAPLFGTAVGAVGSIALWFMGGQTAAVQSALSAATVGAFGVGTDMVLKEKPTLLSVIAAAAPAQFGPGPANGNGNGNGTSGFGAIVPEYSSPGMGAIAMESVGARGRRAGTIGSYGETVSLSGVNTGAFGTPGFQA